MNETPQTPQNTSFVVIKQRDIGKTITPQRHEMLIFSIG
jgi:hypothetical protein